MPASKTLLTGPLGAAVRDRLLVEGPSDPSGLWLVPSPLARTQVSAELGRSTETGTSAPGLVLGRPLAGDP